MSVGLALWKVLVQGAGSRLPRALEEKSGMPQRKPPRSFSYRRSISISRSVLESFPRVSRVDVSATA